MSSIIRSSLKSLVAAVTLTVVGVDATKANLNAASPLQPVDIEMAYKRANLIEGYKVTPLRSDDLGQGGKVNVIPDIDTLSVAYSVDPRVVSKGAKGGMYPVFDDGVSVMPITLDTNNSPQKFFDYTRAYFQSGVSQRDDGSSYDGLAHVHVAIAVDADNPESMEKLKQLNDALTKKLIGDPENGVAGWAEKYGVMVDAIIPMYMSGEKSGAHSNPSVGAQNVKLAAGDMTCIINDHNALFDVDGQCLQDIPQFVDFMEAMFEGGAFYMTEQQYQGLRSERTVDPVKGSNSAYPAKNRASSSDDESGRSDTPVSDVQNGPSF